MLTGETFTIDGLGSPVVLETFAVWCSTCLRQQRRIAEMDRSDIAVVSLNVDPNEDAAKVKAHAEKHGFDWHFAVAPTGMTKQLVDQFGPSVAQPPSAPIITVCPDGAANLLSERGVKSPETIRTAISDC